jgi:hypothetical protein
MLVNGTVISTRDATELAQQIDRRRADGGTVCVEVRINEGDVNMVLATSQCRGTGGSSRVPNAAEERIFALWEKVGLKREAFSGGQLVAFLKQLTNLLR